MVNRVALTIKGCLVVSMWMISFNVSKWDSIMRPNCSLSLVWATPALVNQNCTRIGRMWLKADGDIRLRNGKGTGVICFFIVEGNHSLRVTTGRVLLYWKQDKDFLPCKAFGSSCFTCQNKLCVLLVYELYIKQKLLPWRCS